ncbi:hypothetical protein [Jatrophihabitans fulvus]
MSGGPAVALARHELRSRRSIVLVLGVVAGLFAGLTLAMVTVLLRSDSVFDRLVERTGQADARVGTYNVFNRVAQSDQVRIDLAGVRADILARPDVVDLQQLTAVYVRPVAAASTYYAVWAPTTPWHGIDQPVVVRGRLPSDTAVGEVMVNEQRARQDGIRIGDRVQVGVFAATQVRGNDTALTRPEAGYAMLRVVGVFRSPDSGTGFNRYLAGPAFAQRYATQAGIGSLQLLRLDDTPAPPLRTQVADLNDELIERYGAGFYSYVDLAIPRATPDPVVQPTLAVLRTGLLGFLVVVGAVGLLLTAQVTRRLEELSRPDIASAHALGLSRADQLRSRLLTVLPAALLAGVLGAVGALLGGFIEPPGALEGFEPDPGWIEEAAPVMAGPLVVLALVLLVGGLVSLAASADRVTRTDGPRRGAARRVRVGARANLALALGRGAGSRATAMRVRSTVASTAAIVAALAAAVVLVDELASIEASRARWGWTPDFSVSGDSPALRDVLRSDARVLAADTVVDAPLVVASGSGQVTLTGYGRARVKGELPYELASGSRPERPDQIALGTSAAQELRIGVGDSVTLLGREGRRFQAQVVGLVVLPTIENEPLGRNALVNLPILRAYALSRGYDNIFVRATSQQAAMGVRARLGPNAGTLSPVAPPTVRALDRLVGPGRVLLAVLAGAVLLLVAGHGRQLVRRRGGQLAIAEAIGMPTRRVVAAATAAVVVPGLIAGVVGVPLGWAAGRVTVAEIAPRLGLATRGSAWAELTAGALVVVVLAACAAAFALAVVRLRERRSMSTLLSGAQPGRQA